MTEPIVYGTREATRRLEKYVVTHLTPESPPDLDSLHRLIADVIQAARHEQTPF